MRVKALESLLVEKGLVDPAAMDAIIDAYETKIGPRNGARVVARAWTDPAYKARLLTGATTAIEELGYSGRQGADMLVVENTPEFHNLVVCTLCSCYPWPVLGLPPAWYKSSAYRAKAVIDSRFTAGGTVRSRNINPEGHIRLPRYTRCRLGVIERDHGAHVFPGSHARFAEEAPQPLYIVRFTARGVWDVWGEAANPADTVHADLWEDYLEPA